MAEHLTAEQKLALIRENLHEDMKPHIIDDIILKQNRPLVIYWGTATTGRPHCGYFVAMLKLAQFLQAGCTVKILLADVHGFLDNLKAPIELVNHRASYYRHVITALLVSVNVPVSRLEFVLGSSYQRSERYTMDLYRMCSVVTEHDAKKAGAEVVKQVASPLLSGLIYPLMQALDEEHLGVDAQFGGVDQRKIFALAAEALPKIGYKERAHLMNPMVPGLAGGKMSSSDPDSKIDLLDTAEVVKKKLKKAYAVPKEVEGNGIISFVEFVLLPTSALKNNGKAEFRVERREEEGPPLVYHDIDSLKDDYKNDILNPQLLKAGTTAALVSLLEPIQASFQASKEWQEIEQLAYPPPPSNKKVKKPKVLGTKYQKPSTDGGAKQVEAQPDGSVKGKQAAEVSLGKNVDEAMKKLDVNDKVQK